MTGIKVLTVRLPAEDAAKLEAVAKARHVSVAEEVREAIADRIERKAKSPEVQAQLKDQLQILSELVASGNGKKGVA